MMKALVSQPAFCKNQQQTHAVLFVMMLLVNADNTAWLSKQIWKVHFPKFNEMAHIPVLNIVVIFRGIRPVPK